MSKFVANLQQQVPAGQIIKPWLILGPFYEDFSDQVPGLSYFEKPGAVAGRASMTEVLTAAWPLLTSTPREGEEARFRDHSAQWHLVRRPEKYLAWGKYFISNHLGAAFLSTILVPDTPGPQQWQLRTAMSSHIVVAINGSTVFDSATQPFDRPYGPFTYSFEAGLQPGDNVVTVGLFRLARMAQIGCRLEIPDQAVEARIPAPEGVPFPERVRIEEEVGSLRLGRDVFYPEDEVAVRLGAAPATEARLTLQLQSATGEVQQEVSPTAAGKIRFCQGVEIPDGIYRIVCRWTDSQARLITATSFEAIRKVTPTPSLSGLENYPERKRRVLAHYAAGSSPGYGRPDIWQAVANYGLGQYDAVDEALIRDTCEFIAARKDCADFVIQGLLRLMYWEREQPRLSLEINALMKDTVLGFKYWVDEPGDTVMYMGSENHRLLFHVAEWLAGQLFPTEEFTNSRQRGLYHATKGRMYITEWLRQRGRFGFDEWHSNAYYPICIAPLVNVYDFAIDEDYKLRQMAGALLDYMHFNLAADSLQGVFGTTHGRSYGVYVKYPDFEGTAPTCWLLYGTGSLVKGTSGMAPVSLATSRYQVPEILTRIATDDQAVVAAKIRQGILRGTAPHANFCVYRTPDYLLSGLQDHRKGEFESSAHVAQVTLPGKVVIFWSCPYTSGEGSGLRPDYWSGHIALPRVIQYRNVLALTWRLPELAWMTHCFFEQERLDEVRFAGNWVFGRKQRGYVGIYSQHGLAVGEVGQYAGRELICEAPENTWLVECGRQADWGTFDAFVEALTTARIAADTDKIEYHSPSIGHFVTGWEVTPTVNGEPIALHGYPMLESPWGQAAFGAGELRVQYGDDIREWWFNQ